MSLMEVLVARLVVQQRATLENLLDLLHPQRNGRLERAGFRRIGAFCGGRRSLHDELKARERLARVAGRRGGDEVECCVVEGNAELRHAWMFDGPSEDGDDLLALERRDDDHFRSRQESRVDLERGILRRCADEDDVSRLDVGEKRILLGFVEAVDLVDEDDRLRVAGVA